MKCDQDQEAAHFSGWSAGFGAEDVANRAHDGRDDASAARRIGRNEGRKYQVGTSERIAEGERPLSEFRDECIADAHTEPGLGHSAREEKSGKDEPDGGIAESGKRIGHRECTGQNQGRHGDEDGDAHGNRPRDERNDRSGEEREQMPLAGIERGYRQEIEESAGNKNNGPTPVASGCAGGRDVRAFEFYGHVSVILLCAPSSKEQASPEAGKDAPEIFALEAYSAVGALGNSCFLRPAGSGNPSFALDRPTHDGRADRAPHGCLAPSSAVSQAIFVRAAKGDLAA